MFNALILETSVIEALTISRILKCNKFYLEHFSSVKAFLSARDQMLLRFFFPIISFVVWLFYKFDKFVQVKVIQRWKEHLQKYWIEPP